jgi:hypothetical protein
LDKIEALSRQLKTVAEAGLCAKYIDTLVRVANAGLNVAGFSMSCDCLVRAATKGVTERPIEVRGLKSKEERGERVHPRVFCERVRNRLMGKGLGKHSFLKSAEEYENREVNFWCLVAKSEKSEGAEIGRAPSKLTSTALSAGRVKGREWA